MENAEKPDFKNPIDPDKVAASPSTLPYAHTVSGPVIRPTKRGAIVSRALSAMEEQTHLQLSQIQEQIQLLAKQARAIERRSDISRLIYSSQINFQPVIGHTYFLYEKNDGNYLLSMIEPQQWGKRMPFQAYVASVKLLGDHTWQILEENKPFTQEV